jgi:hypothetical protein
LDQGPIQIHDSYSLGGDLLLYDPPAEEDEKHVVLDSIDDPFAQIDIVGVLPRENTESEVSRILAEISADAPPSRILEIPLPPIHGPTPLSVTTPLHDNAVFGTVDEDALSTLFPMQFASGSRFVSEMRF